MSKSKSLILIILVAILLVAGVVLKAYFWNRIQPLNNQAPITQNQNLEDLTKGIKIFNFLANQKITSPLLVSGEAKGNWFFEASFPVRVIDANGQVLGSIPASAKSNWMVEDYVPFEVRVEFTAPTTTTGEIIFHNDNPSGLPANDIEFRVPVKF